MSAEHRYHINKYIYIYIYINMRIYRCTGFEGKSSCNGKLSFLFRVGAMIGRSCRTAMSTSHQTVLTAASRHTALASSVSSQE